MKELISEIDGSLNHVYPDGSEFRLVKREGYDTLYLSSHTGCSLSCQMCHLTTTGQTKMRPLFRSEMLERVRGLFPHSRQRRHFAFMARGDAMANHHVDWDLIGRLKEGSPESHVSISTIFPGVDDESLTKVLYDRFPSKVDAPQLYWSLYSLDPIVRMRWLPKAGRPDLVAKGLRTWSKSTGKGIALHQALIKGVNDSSLNAHSIVNFLVQYDLPVERVNLVRYNPPDTSSEEASWDSYLEHAEIYVKAFGEKRVNLKPRVGFDVKASCGMFVSL